MSVFEIAQRLYHWIRENGLDPDKIKLVLRCDDDKTLDHLKMVVSHELAEANWIGKSILVNELKNIRINGMNFSFSSLDRSV